MSQAASGKKSNKLSPRSLNLIAGLIFIVFSSCLPQPVDQSLSQNPNSRRTNASGQNNGASDGSGYGNTTANNPSGNSTWSPSNGSISANNNSGVLNNSGSNSNTGNSTNTGINNNTITSGTSDCYKGDAFICKVEQLIGEKTNKYRQGRGLKPLTLDSKIAFVARDWSQKQARSGSISHSGFPSARQTVYRQEFSVSRSLHGENVAMTGRAGGSSQDDAAAERVAEEFAVMWWNSSGHRANMLGNFRSLGCGVFRTSGGSWYATQIFE